MFTGIIQEVGHVLRLGKNRLEIKSSLPKIHPGNSIAVNGACLTVKAPLKKGEFAFDVSAETWRLTNLKSLKAGMAVNMEPALRAGDPLDGHLVSGHVDARAEVLALKTLPGGFALLRVELPKAMTRLVALKGSVAIDGISLTVTKVGRNYFETILVPRTLKHTNLGSRKSADHVNLEADILARYVKAALKP